MAITYSPSIVTNGLVCYYDMSNTQKSWKGAPTTNLLPTPLTIASTWTKEGGFGTVTDNVGYAPDGTQTSTLCIYSSGYLYYVLTLTVGVTYTFSCYVKGNAQTGRGIGLWSYAVSGIVAASSQTINATTWTRVSVTYTVAAGASSFAIMLAGSPSNIFQGTIEVWGPQIEVSSVPSSFINGTRSNTQAILDLMNKNTITATSLTYESGGEFNFNGSGNYMDVTGAGFTSGMTAYTISHWSRRDVESRMPVAGRTSTAFYQFGDNSWYYTHGGVAAEYYYPHAASIPVGTWGNYCIVYNGSNVAIYRNAYLEGTQSTTGTADWSQGMRIGYWSAGGAYAYSGKIGAVQFYNRALSAAEVQQNFNAHRGRYGI